MEIWKTIEENLNYEISSMGRVRRISGGRHPLPFFPKIHQHHTGYTYVHLISGENITFLMIHRAMMKAFVLNPDTKKQVNHINGVKDDNRLENLEWVTPKENSSHAIKTGLHKNGTMRHGSWRTVNYKKCRCQICSRALCEIRKHQNTYQRGWRLRKYGKETRSEFCKR